MTAAARKLPALPQEASKRSTRELFEEGLKRVNVKALLAAEDEYGDDVERELADLQAGRHPLQT